ncbi:MAG: hypothetical protein GX905_07365, partial [Bacteroidales bacterium]|nr:hypothetical protein [Bacteroidales bacterium]
IKDRNPIWNFSSKKDGFWGTNGYVNVAFYPTYESGKENEFNINDFDLFFDKVSADNKVLYLRLNHSIPKVENFNYDSNTPFLTSFIFDSSKLEEKFPELETFGTANDSIRAQITALGLNGEDLKSPEFVIKLKK